MLGAMASGMTEEEAAERSFFENIWGSNMNPSRLVHAVDVYNRYSRSPTLWFV